MKIYLILSATIVPTFVMLIFSFVNRLNANVPKRATDNRFIIEFPRLYFTIGVICVIIFSVAIICFTIFSQELPNVIFYAVYGFFVLVGIYIALRALKSKVIVNDTKITVYRIIFKPYDFLFSDIVSVKRQKRNNQMKSERMVIRTRDGKKLIVESSQISYKRFLKRIKSEVKSELLVGFE